jgi:hypothetical protein
MRKVMLILAMLALMCSAGSGALAEEQASGSEPTPVEAMPAKEPAPTGEAALEKDGQGANGEESSVATPAAPDLAQPVEEKEAPGSEDVPAETMPAEEPAPVEEAAPEKDGQGANEEESAATPAAPDLDAGVGVDPVRAPSDNADAPENEHSSSSDSKEDPDAPK